MSDSTPIPPSLDLESLRKQAKSLLRAVRSGDTAATARVRSGLPSRAHEDDTALAGTLALADVQHLLAREHGHMNWAELKAAAHANRPLAEDRETYLAAVRDLTYERAARLLRDRPALALGEVRAAAAASDVGALTAALATPEGATARDAHDWSPLLYACASRARAGGTPMVGAVSRTIELLLSAGADANDSAPIPGDGAIGRLSALYFASVGGDLEAARTLLEHGAATQDGESIYHAAQLDHRDILALLERHGADFSSRQAPYDNTPLYFLAGYTENSAGAAAATAGMAWLLEHGADPNVTSGREQDTPLHQLIACGRRAEVIRLFLAHGANPNASRADGRTPYTLAVRGGDAAVAAALAEHGANADVVGPADRLIGACNAGDLAAAQEALARIPGALAGLGDADRDEFPRAAFAGRLPAIRTFLAIGFDPAWQSATGGTPLHSAAWHGNVAMVRLLLEHAPALHQRDGTYSATPLGWAEHGSRWCRSADPDYLEIADRLIAAGSGPADVRDRDGKRHAGAGSRAFARHLSARGFDEEERTS